MKTNPTPEEIMVALHRGAFQGDASLPSPTEDEKRKQEVVRAAEVLKAINTVGGSVIKEMLQKMIDDAKVEPESLIVQVDGILHVDANHVSTLIGKRMACNDILSFFTACGRLVDEEANRVAREAAPSNQ